LLSEHRNLHPEIVRGIGYQSRRNQGQLACQHGWTGSG
jgi:hypothetical protein